MRLFLLACCTVPMVAGCTGLALGENDPNGNLGTYIEDGAISVDPTTETAFVLTSELDAGGPSPRLLHAVRAGAATSERVLDLTGREDARMLFVSSGGLVMSQKAEKEHLTVLDRDTFQVRREADSDTWYWGARLSASRRWVGVADNDKPLAPIHVIDAESLEIHVLPHGGDGVEAMFGNVTEWLFAISVDSTTHAGRILGWDLPALEASGFRTGPDGVWGGAAIDVPLAGVAFDALFSYSWVAVSPDDAKVVIPLLAWRDDPAWPSLADYQLVVLDTRDGTTRIVPNAKGPVGFTPDGATIVSYDDEALLLIDADTLAVDSEAIPVEPGISFFVSHEGNSVLVASVGGGGDMVLVDVDHHTQTKMKGPKLSLGLDEFVARPSRDELWAVEGGGLFKIDLVADATTRVPLAFGAEHVGILPKRDEIAIGSDDSRELHFLDPDSATTLRSVDFASE